MYTFKKKMTIFDTAMNVNVASHSDSKQDELKIVPIMKCARTVFIDNFRNISTNSSIQVSVSKGRWVAKKSCHGQTLIKECSISDYPSNFEGL